MKISQKSNINPQKQQHINILSYFNGLKLFKRQHQANLPPRSLLKKERRSPISIKHNFEADTQEKNEINPMSARNTFRSQKFENSQEQNFKGFYTSRNNENQTDMRASFEVQRQGSSKVNTNTMKKQRNSATRNRFYYKQEYDSPSSKSNQNDQSMSQLQKKQSQRILPGYFNKLNPRFQGKTQHNINSSITTRQTRSKSPLEQSNQQLFAKCYKETSHHLNLMLKQIYSSQQNLHFVKKQIMDTVYQALKQRAIALRGRVIGLVQHILDQWESNEWNFLKNNEILFIDDILEMEERLNQKQNKINFFIERLKIEKRQNWKELKNNIQTMKSDTIWKNVTTDLLMFNYENSIIQIQQLTQKISSSVTQKCNKAIDLLASSSCLHKHLSQQIQKPSLYEVNNPEIIMQLKASIMNFLQEEVNSKKKQTSNKVIQQSYFYQNKEDSYFTLSLYQLQENL